MLFDKRIFLSEQKNINIINISSSGGKANTTTCMPHKISIEIVVPVELLIAL